MSANTVSQQLYDMLVSRDLNPKPLDIMGKDIAEPADADLFSFEYKTENKNYGTVVILLDSEQNMEVYFGDTVGKTMDDDDKESWYDLRYRRSILPCCFRCPVELQQYRSFYFQFCIQN